MPEPAAPFLPPIDGVPDPGIRRPDPAERSASTLFRRGNVVDVRAGRVRADTDVLVRGGRIERLGHGFEAGGARVVDLGGRYLMPGLVDLHVHPGMMVGLRMDPDGMTPERVRGDLQRWLRYGVTTVQALGSDRSFTFDVAREQREGRFLGARLLSVGHGFGVDGGVPPFQMDPPGPVREVEPAAIRATVARLAELGASGVKIWYDDWYGQFPKMATEVARTIIERCKERGLRSYAHVYRVDDAKLLIGFGLDALAHMPRDREADAELIDLMRERGTAAIPTLMVPETNVAFIDRPAWVDEPELGLLLPPGSREFLRDERFLATIRAKPEYAALRPDIDRALRNTALLHAGGVTIGFGTDAGVSNRAIGHSELRELELLARAGISNADAMRMATVASAAILGRADEIGEIAPGRRADLLVLRANPLDDLRNVRAIAAVWIDGVHAADALA